MTNDNIHGFVSHSSEMGPMELDWSYLQEGCNCGSIYIGREVIQHSQVVKTLTPNMAGFEFQLHLSLSFFFKFIYLFLAALAVHCHERAFSSCGERGLLFLAVCGLLIVVASLVVEQGL